MKRFSSLDEYINSFVGPKKELLVAFREFVIKLAPESIESLSYGMPGFKYKGKPLVYFAAFKTHIGFFPTPSGIDAIKEAAPFRSGKGTLQFKLNDPIPWNLVEKIIRAKMKEIDDARSA